MLTLHTSNQLEQLAYQFACITGRPLKNILASEKVVVQNAGMARWLSLKVADSTGISANMEVLFPAEFMWQLLGSVLDEVPEKDPCAPAVLRWRLMEILLKNPDEFPQLSHYVSDESSAWDLASELSQLLDQYLFYRDDWIRDWGMDKNSISIQADAIKRQSNAKPEQNWQVRLWQKAVVDNDLVHWLALQDQFVEGIDQIDLSKLPERVSFFSLSALSPGYLRLLGELAKHTDVHLYVINPCQEYWGDIQSEKQRAKLKSKLPADQQDYYETGNPLLASMGRQGRDFLDQLLDLPKVVENTHWKITTPKTLLQNVQHDVLSLTHPESNVDRKIVSDHSIQIHACHTALREVEVLHDQLLDVLQKNPDMVPADIVVMMPDIETYAPYIEAVFSGGTSNQASNHNSIHTTGTKKLPFSIADRNPASSQKAVEALLKVFDLVDARFDAESVFELLDYEEIREKFCLQEAELEQCRELARATNIRWGISADKRKQENLPDTPEHTWLYALDRILLGYAMPGDELFEAHSKNELPLLPYNEIEGSDATMLANFRRFTDVVFTLDDWSKQNLGLEDWLDKLRQLLLDLFAEEDQISDLFKLLENLRQQSQLAEFDIDLPFSVIRKMLKKSLLEVSGTEKFMGHGITFCALVPMRSVPFKVVALLGMNDGEFPRQDKHHSFDLMAANPKRGDRSRRDEDRYLFLESILAAREKLIISYVGQSVQDNSDLPPSVLVSELLDNLALYDGVPGKERVIKHPLQAFSPRYFTPENNRGSENLFSYAQEYVSLHQQKEEQKQISQVFLETPLEELEAEYKHINLDDLVTFYQSPAREFLKKRFAIASYDNDLILPVREPFELESFVDRNVRDQILKCSVESDTVQEASAQIDCDEALLISRAKGLIPHGEIGDQIFSREQQTIDTFKQQLPEFSPLDNHAFKLKIGEFQLNGELAHLTETGRTTLQTGDAYARDYINLWINHLVLNALSFNAERSTSYFYSPETQFSLSPILSGTDTYTDDAKTQLKKLLEYYWKGMSFPLYFFPKPAFKMYEKNKQKGTLKVATDSWENSYLGTSEKNKFENWLLYRAYDLDVLFGHEFESVSELVFGEMFRSYQEI